MHTPKAGDQTDRFENINELILRDAVEWAVVLEFAL